MDRNAHRYRDWEKEREREKTKKKQKLRQRQRERERERASGIRSENSSGRKEGRKEGRQGVDIERRQNRRRGSGRASAYKKWPTRTHCNLPNTHTTKGWMQLKTQGIEDSIEGGASAPREILFFSPFRSEMLFVLSFRVRSLRPLFIEFSQVPPRLLQI